MKEQWDRHQALLGQITKLQPNFVTVWIFQAWNVSYNISVEFDDYRDRYRWVNPRDRVPGRGASSTTSTNPDCCGNRAGSSSHKIGRADEKVQFRRLFREDDDFHEDRPLAERDNWLVAIDWFRRAEDAVDRYDKRISGRSPVVFYSQAPHCRIFYAVTLEEEGTYGTPARVAWNNAADDWNAFGSRGHPH